MGTGPYILDPFQTITGFNFGNNQRFRYLSGELPYSIRFKVRSVDLRYCAQLYFNFGSEKPPELLPWGTIEDEEYINGPFGTLEGARYPGFPPDVVPTEVGFSRNQAGDQLKAVKHTLGPFYPATLDGSVDGINWGGGLYAGVQGLEAPIDAIQTFPDWEWCGWSTNEYDGSVPVESDWLPPVVQTIARREIVSPNSGGPIRVPGGTPSTTFTPGNSIEVAFRGIPYTSGPECRCASINYLPEGGQVRADIDGLLANGEVGAAAGGALGGNHTFDTSPFYVLNSATGQRFDCVGYFVFPNLAGVYLLYEDLAWTEEP